MTSIQKLISEFMEGGGAVYATANGKSGIVFTDENKFIEWRDLGYNSTLGFFRLSQFPNQPNETKHEHWTVHPLTLDDPSDTWRPFALFDGDGSGFVVGERWQLEEMYYRIGRFLFYDELDEPIDQHDEGLGWRWYSISEAVQMAHEYDPDEYPRGERTAERIRRAAQRGTLTHRKTQTGRYKFLAARFRGWLVRNAQD